MPPANAESVGPWAAFRRAHLFDYNAAATRFWLALCAAGAAALGIALWQLASLPALELWQVAGWVVAAALAAAFPVEIPRTKHRFAVGDFFVFLTLALHGPAAAALAAAAEGTVAVLRSSTRLSSRLASPMSATLGMSVSALLFVGVEGLLPTLGASAAAAQLVGMLAAALLYFPASTMPPMQVISLKRGASLRLADWFGASSWVGTMYLMSALAAAMVVLNGRHFGSTVIVAAAGSVGLAAALLRLHFQRQLAEHREQEARVVAAEEEAAQNQRRFHAAFTHAAIGMAIVSPDDLILQANESLGDLLGCPSGQLLGRRFRSLLHPGDATLLERHAAGVAARREEAFSIELRCAASALGETWVSLHCGRFDDPSESGNGLIYQLHDISSRRRAEGDLQHMAYHDSLTDLANRACFHERLQAAVERSEQDPAARFAVMYIDLDRFKVVNDGLGHAAGDQLLKEVALRLRRTVRPADLVARLGGDEFAVLLEGFARRGDLVQLGERLLRALEEPMTLHGTELRPACSIGLTFGDDDARGPAEILRDADLAMYKAKADGKGRMALFDSSLSAQISDRLQLETDLRRAIDEKSLTLAYQPLYWLEPHRLDGFEALVRWQHPQRGAISPSVFVPLAEETGCIEALTRLVVDEAVRQLALWRNQSPQAAELVMHVNVSGKDLAKPQFVAHVRQVLKRHALPPRLLTLEITESTLMEHRDAALLALAELRELGVKVGIDDFGTGYSSLAYLSTLPFDCLKIDRSFVIGMQDSAQNLEIVRTVVSLGRTLNKHVVAEGIETPAQLRCLKQLGATIGQGYLLSRPRTPAQVAELLAAPELEAVA